MSDEYIPGEGCKCGAHCSCECGCDTDWTPKRVYQLESELLLLDEQIDTLFLRFGKTQERMINAERALQKIADWELAPDYDPMDAVREIAREALGAARTPSETANTISDLLSGENVDLPTEREIEVLENEIAKLPPPIAKCNSPQMTNPES